MSQDTSSDASLKTESNLTNIENDNNEWKNTPLFSAVVHNQPHTARYLITQKANVNTCNKDDVPVLYQAAAQCHKLKDFETYTTS